MRKVAPGVVVALSLVIFLWASLTQEPIRAAIWQLRAQSCGTIVVQGESYPFGTDSATMLQEENCFMRGYTRCQAVRLGYGSGGIDFSETDTFVVEPAEGWLAGCAIADIYKSHIAAGKTYTATHRCTRAVREADYSLHIQGCGGGEDIVISAPLDIPPTKSPNIPRTSATLGGSVFAFDNQFGVYHCCDHSGWDYQGPYGPLWVGVYTGAKSGYSGYNGWYGSSAMTSWTASSSQRVVGIVNTGALDVPTEWTVGEAQAICRRFLPPDAQYEATTTMRGHDQGGLEDFYTSVSLANTVLPTYFKDWTGQPATPGAFYIVYNYFRIAGPNAPTIGMCRVGTDEQWTQNLP